VRVFDWKPFFAEYRVPFIEKGANVKRGEINIKCPWCGSADPSYHMGVNLETGWFSCWRNRKGHSGKSPLRLIVQLTKVPYWKAREIAGLGADYVDPDGFDAVAARVMGRDAHIEHPRQARREFLDMDKYAIPITSRPQTLRWFNYLYGRFFERDDIEDLCYEYGLKAARHGNYAGRLIIPYYMDGKLVTWTARAIGQSSVRYLDHPVDDSLVPVKEVLYNVDAIAEGGRTLAVVEGPMDVLKLDFYGKRYGLRAVGMSTNSINEHQVYALEEASDKFDEIVIMMDNKTDYGIVDSMRLKDELQSVPKLRIDYVPFDRGDPGELRSREVIDYAEKAITRRTRK
jgi:hypothetical protein